MAGVETGQHRAEHSRAQRVAEGLEEADRRRGHPQLVARRGVLDQQDQLADELPEPRARQQEFGPE
ncbi:hypothetical protein [Streptomyces sp. NBC_00343]|uniref:hypothetical protein n=1 Tax=Streptomyces sp. NBC_00343 TaxID=2975719 RepID=UPI002E2CBB0E|nr:hypothetical protein [Streptomyces sp. NBC_00343]